MLSHTDKGGPQVHELSTVWHIMAYLPCDTDTEDAKFMNCPHPSQPFSHTMLMRGDAKFMHELSTLWPITAFLPHNADARRCKVYAWTVHTLTHHSLSPTQCWCKEMQSLCMNCPHSDPSQPTSHTMLMRGDAKFMHELSTLWPITAYLPHNADARRCKVYAWTVHTLTHHSPPPTQCWCEEMQSLCMNCPHSDPSQPFSHTMLMWGDAKFMHELSTLWPITAFLPHNADVRRCKVYAWTVHTLTHRSLPPTQCWCEEMQSLCMNCPHSDPLQPTSHTMLMWGDAKFMHELSTLWPITAFLPHNADARRCKVYAWTVHTLTHHSPPPTQCWCEEMQSLCMNCPHSDPSQPTSHLPTMLMEREEARSRTVHASAHHSLPPAQQWQEEELPSSCMNCPHFDPSWPTSHVTLTLTGDDAKFMNCQHFHSSQPPSNTMLTVGGDAKFMHELSTLWPVMAHLPCDTDADTDRGWCQVHELSTLSLITASLQHNADSRRRCQVHAWTVHTLTRHGPPPMWHWRWHWQGMMPSSWTVNTFTHHSLPPTQCWQ